MAAVIVLDAGALIALFDSRDTHHDWALDVFVQTAGDELVMSTLTYAEVLVHPIRENRVNIFESSIEHLGVRFHPIDATDARRLADVRATSKLKMPDAVVLSTGLAESATIATTDEALSAAARKSGLKVLHP